MRVRDGDVLERHSPHTGLHGPPLTHFLLGCLGLCSHSFWSRTYPLPSSLSPHTLPGRPIHSYGTDPHLGAGRELASLDFQPGPLLEHQSRHLSVVHRPVGSSCLCPVWSIGSWVLLHIFVWCGLQAHGFQHNLNLNYKLVSPPGVSHLS